MKKFITNLTFLIIILFFVQVQASEQEFSKLVSFNSYINPNAIVRNPDGNYSIIIKSYNKGQYEPIRGNFVSYTLTEHIIDCNNSTYKLGIIDSYDDDDGFINGDYNRYSTFQPIVQGTSVGAVYNLICKP